MHRLLPALACLVFLGACNTRQTEEKKPNIILFLVDDMGWQDTSVPFHTERTPFNDLYETPAMERLAAGGMKFTQAYSNAVCTPTRVSLMTGMNAARHRVTNWTLRKGGSHEPRHPFLVHDQWNVNGLSMLPGTERTVVATPLPEVLRKGGYSTVHVGKAHFAAIGTSGADPLNLGFEINIAGHAAGAPGSYLGTDSFFRGDPGNVWAVPGLDKYHGQHIYLTEALTREAISVLDSLKQLDKPFFLYMAHYAVHTPIMADKRYFQKYMDKGMDSTEAAYATMVEGMDKSLGDLMDWLDLNGKAGETVILFTSDNGGLSAVARGGERHTHNRPLSSGKGSAHEGGIREPMLVSWPGITPGGSTSDEKVIIEDIFPTILGMTGLSGDGLVQIVDGKDLGPVLSGTGSLPERSLFWHYPNFWGPSGPGIGSSSTIRKGDWKLIYYHTDRSFELFDLSKDLGESINMYDNNGTKAAELAEELGSYLRSVEATMPYDSANAAFVPWPDEVVAN